MAHLSPIDQIAERVERLLVRHTALEQANIALAEQVSLLTQERDSFRLRLHAARARVDTLLELLPVTPPAPKEPE